MSRLPDRPSHLRANIALGLSAVAAFSAVGGPAVAADGATAVARAAGLIDGKNLKKGSVASAQIKDGSIATKDLSAAVRGQLATAGSPGPAGAAGRDGAVGPAGAAGAKGEKGDKGEAGPQGPQGPAGSSSAGGAPSGPAGGALTGSYPNPAIAADAVTAVQLADNSILSNTVQDNTLRADDLATNSVGYDELQPSSVDAAQLRTGAVNNTKIAAGAAAINIWSTSASPNTMSVSFLGGITSQANATVGMGVYSVPFQAPSTTPIVNVLDAGAAPTSNCPGSFAAPNANNGYLCVYVGSRTAAGLPYSPVVTRYGATFAFGADGTTGQHSAYAVAAYRLPLA